MAEPPRIRVEVAYAQPQRQFLRALSVAAGASVRSAIHASGVLEAFPEIDLASLRVGVWSRVLTLDAPLREGDRVELYRPLQVDPKEVRRQRAERAPIRKRPAR
jgi:putative ubiquitin-RnfH superfamily antitoxin RatB of RatAB toxin-antitoxin module